MLPNSPSLISSGVAIVKRSPRSRFLQDFLQDTLKTSTPRSTGREERRRVITAGHDWSADFTYVNRCICRDWDIVKYHDDKPNSANRSDTTIARLNKARLAGLLGDDAIVWKNIVYLDSDVTLLCVKPDWMIRDFLSCTYRGLRRCDSGPAQNFFDLPFSRLAPRGFCRQSGCDE